VYNGRATGGYIGISVCMFTGDDPWRFVYSLLEKSIWFVSLWFPSSPGGSRSAAVLLALDFVALAEDMGIWPLAMICSGVQRFMCIMFGVPTVITSKLCVATLEASL